jgi:macrolide transport system ATP-binding/permease protein
MKWWPSRKRHAESERELRSDLELEEEEQQERGVSPDEAWYAARRAFGNTTLIKEQMHEAWGGARFERFWQDLRYALRVLGKNRGFSATAILVLTLGIGTSVAIFAFVDAALIRPLPYADPQRLVHVTESDPTSPHVNISYLDYLDWKKQNTTLASMDVFTGWNMLLSTPTGTESVPGERVSLGFFRTLGVAPLLGRDFHQGEDTLGAPGVVMLSYGTWQRRFGGKKDVVGQSLKLSGVSHTIIGVLPKGFEFALGSSPQFWTALQPDNSCEKRRDCHNLYAVGRLKDGVTVQAAAANMQSIAVQLERQYPDANQSRGANVMPLSEAIVGDIRPILLLLLSGAGLLLLIACVNVSSLLVVHTERRKREIAVRGALGASRARLGCQFVTEGLVLVVGGSLAGLAFAYVAMQIPSRLISKDLMARMPYLSGLELNTHVLAFAGILGLLASIVFSLTPILHLSSSDMRDDLTEGGRGAAGTLWRRIGGRLVVIELATTMVLLTGAGLLGKSLYRLLHVDVGFQADHLSTLQVRLPGAAFPGDPQQVAFVRRLLPQVESLPGVRAAAVTSLLPVTCDCNTDWVRIVGKPYSVHITANERDVSAGFFTTLHARLLAGRYFTDAEDASKPKVVIINHAFARKYFAGEEPVGKRLGDPTLSPPSIKQIIGVVEDFKDGGLDGEQSPTVYYPFNQSAGPVFALMVRTAQDDQTIQPALAATVHQLNMDVGVEQGSTMREQINDSQPANFHRCTAYVVGGFAVLALILSAVGLYGVIAYSVSQRTREIGVRMALGAQRGSVYKLVLRQAGWLTGTGLAIGLICSIGASLPIRSLLFGVQPWDAVTLSCVATLLAVASIAATFIPARRAASVDPMQALRSE